MSYGVRWISPDGKTGHSTAPFATREDAESHAALRQMENGLSYTVEEVPDAPEPTSATQQLVSLFRDLHGGQQIVPNEADGVEYVPGVKPEPTSTTDRLVGLIRDRHAKGLAKYGTTLDRTDLSPEDWAQHAIEEALDLAGYLMRLKDGFAPEPVSMAAHHVEILRERVKELEALVATLRKNLGQAYRDNDDIHRELAFALDLGRAMREAMHTGEWRPGHDKSMANSAIDGWDRWKRSLAKAYSVPVGASDAPGEGGDSDLRRLEALRAFLEDNEDASLSWWEGEFSALFDGVAITAPTLAALADKLAEKDGKP